MCDQKKWEHKLRLHCSITACMAGFDLLRQPTLDKDKQTTWTRGTQHEQKKERGVGHRRHHCRIWLVLLTTSTGYCTNTITCYYLTSAKRGGHITQQRAKARSIKNSQGGGSYLRSPKRPKKGGEIIIASQAASQTRLGKEEHIDIFFSSVS